MPEIGFTTRLVPETPPPTDRLRLIPVLPDHAPLWYAWRQEASTQRHNPVDPIDASELATRLSGLGSDCRDESRSDFRWMVELDGTWLIGTVALKDANWRMLTGELAWGIGEAWQGVGWGTAAVQLLIREVFSSSRLQRLYALIHVENAASRQVAERNGMRLEGTLRQHFLIQGVRVDECVYGLLRSEWTG